MHKTAFHIFLLRLSTSRMLIAFLLHAHGRVVCEINILDKSMFIAGSSESHLESNTQKTFRSNFSNEIVMFR